MRLSFDLDGVLADFGKACNAIIRERYAPDVSDDYVMQQWSYAEILSDAQWHDVFDAMMNIPNMWADLPSLAENVAALRLYTDESLMNELNTHFITSRPPCRGGSPVTMTGLWLQSNGLPMCNLHVVSHSDQKRALIQEYGIQYSLDDLPRTVIQCNTIPGHKAYVLDQPYNRAAVENNLLPHVGSVADFLLEVSLESNQ